MNVNNIQLIGNSFNIQPSAFTGIDQSYLSIDLSGSSISSYAFLSGGIDALELLNLEYANYTTVNNKTYKGLYSNSLRTCDIVNLMFSDINNQISALSNSTYLNQQLSVTGLSYPCVVTTSAESIIYQQNNKFEIIPNCLSLDSTHTIILSCTNSKVPSYNYSIYIPNYISAINDNAFENCDNIEMLYIPSSMKRIGDNAFKNCTNLENISFSLGIQLEYIGNNIFSGCSTLESIYIPS